MIDSYPGTDRNGAGAGVEEGPQAGSVVLDHERDSGLGIRTRQAARYTSGAGFPLSTSSAAITVQKNSFNFNLSRILPVPARETEVPIVTGIRF